MHLFKEDISAIDLPRKFTYPFCYTPHPLSVLAAEEVKAYVGSQSRWHDELEEGKMFGVLVVRDREGRVGYLAAFSGLLEGRNDHEFFVPPVYDMLQEEGFFRCGERQISAVNRRIEILEHDGRLLALNGRLAELETRRERELCAMKQRMKEAKSLRDARRRSGALTEEELGQLMRESSFLKAEYKRRERAFAAEYEALKGEKASAEEEIERLKAERRQRSAALQQQLFSQFVLLNARGERRDLCDIFLHDEHRQPPAGAGECAAPKLLQYAYSQGLYPLAMAEFWWGRSPRREIRRHGAYYPSCTGKCRPILRHMLQGLEVEENPLESDVAAPQLETLYEDDALMVVNKPEGMLSVDGKGMAKSVEALVRETHPDIAGPVIVHRLDMATSGLLVIAKNKEVHLHLQRQFKERRVVKRYVALLDGIVPQERGRITLPLCLNPDYRPMQMVSYEYGRPAVTDYEVLEYRRNTTLLALYPVTGRTHQLRVHCAHPSGLGIAIVGDRLYGRGGGRLCLHAESITFTHPVTGEVLTFCCRPDFV